MTVYIAMASGPPANHLQASDDHLQVPPWSGTVILGRCVQPGLVCRRQVAAAVGKQQGTRRATHKDHDQLEGLCRGWPGHMEQPPSRPADFITIQRYIREKTRNSFNLAASVLEVFSNWALYKMTYSFIHSFIHERDSKVSGILCHFIHNRTLWTTHRHYYNNYYYSYY